MQSMVKVGAVGLEKWQRTYEESGQRLPYLCVFDPGYPDRCLETFDRALDFSGFRGMKIHPTFHKTPVEDHSYEAAWRFAAKHELPIMSHTWSVSSYNPGQALSAPVRFEACVRRYPTVPLVPGNSGGRGEGRYEAIRMARKYENVYMDFAGDIYFF